MFTFIFLQGNSWYGVAQNGQAVMYRSEVEAMRAAETHARATGAPRYAIVDGNRQFHWWGTPGQGWVNKPETKTGLQDYYFPDLVRTETRRWGA